MKRIFSISIIFFLMSVAAIAQPDRIGGGLAFSPKIRFNLGDTGNPGLTLRTWIKLDKRKTMFIVPSITAYNPHTITHTSNFTTNYLFHGDLDFQYRFYNEGTLAIYALTGANYTYLYSAIEMRIPATNPPVNASLYGLGPNIGAGLEMRMSSFVDFNVSAKYTFPGLKVKVPGTISIWNEENPRLLSSPLTALVIQVQAVYYFKGRGKGWRR